MWAKYYKIIHFTAILLYQYTKLPIIIDTHTKHLYMSKHPINYDKPIRIGANNVTSCFIVSSKYDFSAINYWEQDSYISEENYSCIVILMAFAVI